MRFPRAIWLWILTVALAFAPEPLRAESPSQAELQARLQGRYVCENPSAASAAIDRAIDEVVGEMLFLVRPFARAKLRSTNPVMGTVSFEFTGGQLKYTYNGRHVIQTTIGGPAVQWKAPEDGESYRVTQRMEGQKLVQTIRGEDGTMQETFELSSDLAILKYRAVVTSPKLPRPLTYQYNFRRR